MFKTSFVIVISALACMSSAVAQPPAPGAPVIVNPPAPPELAGAGLTTKPAVDDQKPAVCPPEILEAAKAKQRLEYTKCKSSYDYWCGEVARLAAKATPDQSHLVVRAQGKVKELAAQAKELVSPEYLDSLISKELAAKSELDKLYLARDNSIKKDLALEEAERQRLAAEAEAARKLKAAAEEEARKEAALLAEARRLNAIAEAAAERAQEEEDKKTWGVITPHKYNRLELEMEINNVEKILGPGTMLSSITNPIFGTVTDYQWLCKNRSARVDITFHGSKLYDKRLTPLANGDYQLIGAEEGE